MSPRLRTRVDEGETRKESGRWVPVMKYPVFPSSIWSPWNALCVHVAKKRCSVEGGDVPEGSLCALDYLHGSSEDVGVGRKGV